MLYLIYRRYLWGDFLNTIRRDAIKDILNTKGEVLLSELAEVFPDCSTMTLRRDLKYLEDNGFVKRIRGGAVALSRLSMSAEDVYSYRALDNIAAKKLIADKAANYIEHGRSLYLDSGTTIMQFAKNIPDDYITIITSGPNIALELIKKANPNVTLVGGQLNRNTISLSGASANIFLTSVNIDIAFMSASGFSLQNGFTGGTYSECELKRDVLARAAKVIVLMDSSKVGKSLPYTFGSFEDIDILISDDNLPDEIIAEATDKKVTIV